MKMTSANNDPADCAEAEGFWYSERKRDAGDAQWRVGDPDMLWWSPARKKRREVSTALDGYPVYSPPHCGEDITEQQGRENYEYFLAHKAYRIEAARAFLQIFSIYYEATRDNIIKIGDWLWEYGEFLLPEGDDYIYIHSIVYYDPPFVGSLAGLNVITDIGNLVGDYLVSKSAGRLYWGFNKDDAVINRHNHFRPCIFGLDRRAIGGVVPLAPPHEVFEICEKRRQFREIGATIFHSADRRGYLVARIEQCLDDKPRDIEAYMGLR
jgi:hypothetical protein